VSILSVAELRQIVKEKLPPSLVIPEHDHLGHHYRFVPTNKVYDSVTTKTSILENPRLKRWAANLAVQYIDRNWKLITPGNKDDHYKAAILAHEDELQDAGDIGTQGHHAIERYLKRWIDTNIKPEDIRKFILGEDARLWAIARSAEMFINDFGLIPIASEIYVASPRHEFAGTLDCLAILLKEKEPGKHRHSCEMWSGGRKYWECYDCGKVVEPVLSIVDWKTSNSVDKPEYAMQISAYWQGLAELTGLRTKELVIVRLDKDKAKYEVVRVQDRPAAFRAFKHVGKIHAWINNGVSKLLPYSPKEEIFL
jgi:hypothetical protein